MFKSLSIVMMLLLSSLSGCKERLPLTNTDNYNQLHGIVNDGSTVNEITMVNERNGNRPRLRFPAEVEVNVFTLGTDDTNPVSIKKGIADKASVGLQFNAEQKLVPIVKGEKNGDLIRIDFIASLGPDSPQLIDERLLEVAREAVQKPEKQEWGLREFVLVVPKTEMISGYAYVPLDQSFRSMDGARMWIGCHAGGSKITNSEGPASCASNFNVPGGLGVTYEYGSRLLPFWRQIHEQVLEFTKSVLVTKFKNTP
ncbi:hypothetical protein [Collimonas humicola]|uniref:hypothetical protein n=1 Tax=Collimonas humicola TaxID=2825886 RepID=UPI001B8C98F3|nr:hypothetical protein [Collimonas humicola]